MAWLAASAASRAGQRDADGRVLENGAVFEPHPLGLGDVAQVADDVVTPVHLEARRRQQGHHPRPGLGLQHDRAGAHAARLRQVAQHRVEVAPVVPDADLDRGLADQFVARIAAQAHEAVVHQRAAAAAHFGQGDAVGAGREQVREHGFGAAQGGFGRRPRGDVVVDRERGWPFGCGHAHTRGLHAELSPAERAELEIGHRDPRAHRHRFELGGSRLGSRARIALEVQAGDVEARHRRAALEAEHAGGCAVGVEHHPATVQQQRRGRTLEQLAVARFAGRIGALRHHHVGDIAAHAHVAQKFLVGIEAGLAADADEAQPALRVAAPRQGAAEGAVRLQVGAVCRELGCGHAQPGQFPRRAPQAAAGVDERAGDGIVRNVDKAELIVLLPVPIDAHAQHAAETTLALIQMAVRFARHARHHDAHRPACGQQRPLHDDGAGQRCLPDRQRTCQVPVCLGQRQAEGDGSAGHGHPCGVSTPHQHRHHTNDEREETEIGRANPMPGAHGQQGDGRATDPARGQHREAQVQRVCLPAGQRKHQRHRQAGRHQAGPHEVRQVQVLRGNGRSAAQANQAADEEEAPRHRQGQPLARLDRLKWGVG